MSDQHCKPCKDLGRLVVAHFPAEPPTHPDPECWDHRHHVAVLSPELSNRPLEQCQYGIVPRGVCLNAARAERPCHKKRSHLDCTGFCRDCKIEKGIAVAPSKAKAKVKDALPAPPADLQRGAAMADAFMINVFNLLPAEKIAASVKANWAKIPRVVQEQIVTQAVVGSLQPAGNGHAKLEGVESE